jgi:precorrin-2/cobalt-factor-2 C20-methyltransferase
MVVPGVSSINASAAAAGIPLVDGAERLAVLPAVYEGEDIETVLRLFDTVVFLKVNRAFDRVLDALEKLDLAGRAVYVKRCGSPEQEVVHDVRKLRGQQLDYLSLMIVKR